MRMNVQTNEAVADEWIIKVDDKDRMEMQMSPSGWWILPMIGFGSLVWVGIFRLIFW